MDLLTEIRLIMYNLALTGTKDITLWHPGHFRLRQDRDENVVEQNFSIRDVDMLVAFKTVLKEAMPVF